MTKQIEDKPESEYHLVNFRMELSRVNDPAAYEALSYLYMFTAASLLELEERLEGAK